MSNAYLSRWVNRKSGAFGGYVLHLEAQESLRLADTEADAAAYALAGSETQMEVEVDSAILRDLLSKQGSAFFFDDELDLRTTRSGSVRVELAFPLKAETLSRVRGESGFVIPKVKRFGFQYA
jgi:hypothetical protein